MCKVLWRRETAQARCEVRNCERLQSTDATLIMKVPNYTKHHRHIQTLTVVGRRNGKLWLPRSPKTKAAS